MEARAVSGQDAEAECSTLNPVASWPDLVPSSAAQAVGAATHAAPTDVQMAVLPAVGVPGEGTAIKKPTVLGRGRSALAMLTFVPQPPPPPIHRPPKDVGGVGCHWWQRYLPLMLALVAIIVPCVLLLPTPGALPPTPRASMDMLARFEGVSPLTLMDSNLLLSVGSSLSHALVEVTDVQPLAVHVLFIADGACIPVWGADSKNMTGRALRADVERSWARALALADCTPTTDTHTAFVGFSIVLGSSGSVSLLEDLLVENNRECAGYVQGNFTLTLHQILVAQAAQGQRAGQGSAGGSVQSNTTMAALMPMNRVGRL